MSTWRITVSGKEAEDRDAFKEAHFKALYQASGDKVVFELPENDEAGADALVAEAKEQGFEAEKEAFDDPLESADTAVDFW